MAGIGENLRGELNRNVGTAHAVGTGSWSIGGGT
jgi:hypothetical protein